MEMVIPEFEGCSQEEILNCLDLASITSNEVASDTSVSYDLMNVIVIRMGEKAEDRGI